jgi:hypothetical protein
MPPFPNTRTGRRIHEEYEVEAFSQISSDAGSPSSQSASEQHAAPGMSAQAARHRPAERHTIAIKDITAINNRFRFMGTPAFSLNPALAPWRRFPPKFRAGCHFVSSRETVQEMICSVLHGIRNIKVLASIIPA